MKLFNLQRFAEDNIIKTTDLEPAISIDLTSKLSENLKTLNAVLSANELTPMTAGSVIKMYEMVVTDEPKTEAGEGEVIGLTKIERRLKKTVEITLKKRRKQTTAEAIQKTGRDVAVNQTDEKLIKVVQKEIKNSFFDLLKTGTGTATATAEGLQPALASAWGAVQKRYEDIDATPIYFISTDDASDYLAKANITLQTSFGMTYVENFLGLGTAFISPSVPAGNIYATAKENLHCAYIPARGGDVATTFGLISDTTGLVGMTHAIVTNTASVETLLLAGVMFYPEDVDGVIKVAVKGAQAPATPAKTPTAGKAGK